MFRKWKAADTAHLGAEQIAWVRIGMQHPTLQHHRQVGAGRCAVPSTHGQPNAGELLNMPSPVASSAPPPGHGSLRQEFMAMEHSRETSASLLSSSRSPAPRAQ